MAETETTLPGGRYRAEQQRDGTWTLHDVPVMGELPEGTRGNDFDVGRDWFQRVIRNHRRREQEGHLARVHVNHHKIGGKETRGIGFFRPTRVGTLKLEGRRVDVLFADLLGIDDFNLERIAALEFPYRSVEIIDFENAEISSLALLEDESPFFKLPMVSVGERIPNLAIERTQRTGEPMLAHSAVGDAESFLFNFQEADMPGDHGKNRKKDEDEKKKALQEKEKKKKDDEKKSTTQLSEEAATIRDEIKRDLPSLIAEAIRAANASDDSKEPAEQETTASESSSSGQLSEADKRVIQLEAKVEHLEKDSRERAEKEEIDSLVSNQKASLEEGGWFVPDSTVEKMRDIARGSKAPKESLKVFCDAWKSSVPKEPVRTIDEITEHGGSGSLHEFDDAKEVMAFAEQGPQKLEEARRAAADYQQFKRAAGSNMRSSLEDWLRVNVASGKE